jgi:hypothetical protein
MSDGFKKLLIMIIALIIGYASSYLVNQSPIKITVRKNYSKCSFDCGFSPFDNEHSLNYGVPIIYKSETVLSNGTNLGTVTNDKNNLLYDNLIFMGLAELFALGYIVFKAKQRKI